jgi:hypothetical protein
LSGDDLSMIELGDIDRAPSAGGAEERAYEGSRRLRKLEPARVLSNGDIEEKFQDIEPPAKPL